MTDSEPSVSVRPAARVMPPRSNDATTSVVSEKLYVDNTGSYVEVVGQNDNAAIPVGQELAEGANLLRVTVIDEVGLAGNSTPITVNVDTTAPTVTLMSPADTSTDNDGNVTVQYNVTDDLAASLTCDVYSNTSGSWTADLAGQTTANGASNTHSYAANTLSNC